MMQNQGMTSKIAVKVPKRQDLRAEGKKIKSAFNMLIQARFESRRKEYQECIQYANSSSRRI